MWSFSHGKRTVQRAWKNDHMEGHGTYTYASGSKYVGAFKNGKSEGHGTYTYANGTSWTGKWEKGNKKQ